MGGRRWTKAEDGKLRHAVMECGAHNWARISTEHLAGHDRSELQCCQRWQKVLRPGLIKGPWTQEEDEALARCIQLGVTKWSDIAERIPGRISKQCRERWCNHVDPSLKKGTWTPHEDALLIARQKEWGNAWSRIAKLMPGRSENSIKNRFNSAQIAARRGVAPPVAAAASAQHGAPAAASAGDSGDGVGARGD